MDVKTLQIQDLIKEIDIQAGSIVSKALYHDAAAKIVLFGFDAEQELSQHTASVPAVMHFLEGEAEVTIGDDTVQAEPNSFYFMEASVPHSITARQPTKMLLTLFKPQTRQG
ncbi:MAG: cupin domain-containing protein [Pirellulales bacterium]|nr:cupin domain-containing protein [Pirellulales bacterium]